MTFLRAVRLTFPSIWSMPEHQHDDFEELIVMFSGTIRTRLADGRDLIVRAGESVLYPRGMAHCERSVGSKTVQMACISLQSDKPAAIHSPDIEGRVRLLAQWLTELETPLNPEDRRTAEALLTAISAERAARCGGEPEMLRLVRRYVSDHLAEVITLDDLASVAGLSRFHFARSFRAATGESPMAFVRRQRIEATRSLLAAKSLPLRTIAEMVGISDEFTLSRIFKRSTGESPRWQYRSRNPL